MAKRKKAARRKTAAKKAPAECSPPRIAEIVGLPIYPQWEYQVDDPDIYRAANLPGFALTMAVEARRREASEAESLFLRGRFRDLCFAVKGWFGDTARSMVGDVPNGEVMAFHREGVSWVSGVAAWVRKGPRVALDLGEWEALRDQGFDLFSRYRVLAKSHHAKVTRRMDRFQRGARAWCRAFQDEHGRPPKREEFREWVKELDLRTENYDKVFADLTEPQYRILEELHPKHRGPAKRTGEDLAKRLNVGRTTFFEAVRLLKDRGLVANKRGFGYYRPDMPPKPVTDE